MPYKSAAQRGMFHWLESKGKLPSKTVNEFDKASKGMDLPEYVKKKKMSQGGAVGEEGEVHEPEMHDYMEPEESLDGPHSPEEPMESDEGDYSGFAAQQGDYIYPEHALSQGGQVSEENPLHAMIMKKAFEKMPHLFDGGVTPEVNDRLMERAKMQREQGYVGPGVEAANDLNVDSRINHEYAPQHAEPAPKHSEMAGDEAEGYAHGGFIHRKKMNRGGHPVAMLAHALVRRGKM